MSFYCHCGWSVHVEAVFVAEKEYVDYLTTHDIYVNFTMAGGEYDEVRQPVKKSDIKFLTDDRKVINIVEEFDLESGFNPLCQDLGLETEGLEETGIDWDCRTVKEYIDYKLHGMIPKPF